MSKQRKLQQEVDVVLKKIRDNVCDWDRLWDKLEELDVSAVQPQQRCSLSQGCMGGRDAHLPRCLGPVKAWCSSMHTENRRCS